MSTRDEIEQALDDHAASVASYERATVFQSPYRDMRRAEMDAARARLLALLAPEPEPSEAEIEAGAKALHARLWHEGASRSQRGCTACRNDAKAVLLAARASRQTGGE